MYSRKKTARMAGLLYLVLILSGIFDLRYIPSRLIVPDNGSATVKNIIASETLFRAGILSELIGYILYLLIAMVLYRLFKEINNFLSFLMLIFVAITVPISFTNLLNKFAVLTFISHPDYIHALAADHLQAQVLLYLDFYSNGNLIGEIFWGLWLFPFGYLVYKSGFLPKVLGVLLMAGCFCYLIDFTGSFLFSRYDQTGISTFITLPASIGELGICLWLLIMGAKEVPKNKNGAINGPV